MDILATVASLLVIGVFSWIVYDDGKSNGHKESQQEAINKGFAQYNSKTGEFEWKGEGK